MEHHPLLKELQAICLTHNLDEAKAYLTFQSYLELSQGKKFQDLQYGFNKSLKLFYILGKIENESDSDLFVPVMLNDELSPKDLDSLYSELCSAGMKLHLIIRDRDSSSTCYKITRGLIPPLTPMQTKEKKDFEMQNYQLEQMVQKNRKKLYMKALKKS